MSEMTELESVLLDAWTWASGADDFNPIDGKAREGWENWSKHIYALLESLKPDDYNVDINAPSPVELDSLPEKRVSNKEFNCTEHWMYVSELKNLLSALKDDDWLTPNMVGNLNVGRDNNEQFATIDFAWNRIEYWGLDKETPENE